MVLLLQHPPDRRLADVVHACQRGHRLALAVAVGDLAALASVELGLAAELLALCLRAGDALVAALADQAGLELADAAHDRQHQAADVALGCAIRVHNYLLNQI
jgi:hypothetical protein